MTYITPTEFNMSGGIHRTFLYVAEVVPIFFPLILMAFFLISLLGIYFSQRRLTGQGDFFVAFAVAGYLVTLLAFAFSLFEGLIGSSVVIICVVVSLVATALLFITRR